MFYGVNLVEIWKKNKNNNNNNKVCLIQISLERKEKKEVNYCNIFYLAVADDDDDG